MPEEIIESDFVENADLFLNSLKAKMRDEPPPIEGTYDFQVIICRLETSQSGNPDFSGKQFLYTELECMDEPYVNRRLWLRYWLHRKRDLQTIKNVLFRVLSLDIGSTAQIEEACPEMINKKLAIRCWAWARQDDIPGEKSGQGSTIKGLARDQNKINPESVPF